MKKNDIKTPIGTRDRLFDECRARRQVEEALRGYSCAVAFLR